MSRNWPRPGMFVCALASLVVSSSYYARGDDAALRGAVTLYASFDEQPRADFGTGDHRLWTRYNHATEKDQTYAVPELDTTRVTVDKAGGVHGGALACSDVLPRGGRAFFRMGGHLAYQKGGWSGAASVWINIDPNTQLKTPFCDPIQITQFKANNGAIWFDFPDTKPRDMRMGTYPALAPGQTPLAESDPKAAIIPLKNCGFKQGDWHHVVLCWENYDTGKSDARIRYYVDGKLIGQRVNENLHMDWDVDQARIYVAVSYIGLLDELALFRRALSEAEVQELYRRPGLLAGLSSPPGKDSQSRARSQLQDFQRRVEAAADKNSKTVAAQVEKLRAELFAALATDDARESAESYLALLWRLPRPPIAVPAPPAFPFAAAAAALYQREYALSQGLPVEVTTGEGAMLRLIPPGTFWMGSPDDEPGHKESAYDETRHQVTLTRPFYLSQYETTVGQFRRFTSAASYVTDGEKTGGGNAHDERGVWQHRPGTWWQKPGYAGPFELRDELPVVHASHTDALAYCGWLNEEAGLSAAAGWQYALPGESQWEWACRAGSASRYGWGADEDATGRVANVGDQTLRRVHPQWPRATMPMDDGHAFPAPVGSYRPNGFGLFDMLGNVWEFCSSHYGPYPKTAVTDPDEGDPKRGFAVRGGGWSNAPNDARCATRNADPPHFCHSNLGFRVALMLPAER